MLTQNFMIKYFKKNMNKINSLVKPKNLVRLLLGVLPFLMLLVTISCEEEPNSLGANLLPDDDKIVYYYDTTITFEGSIFDKSAVITSDLSQYPIGIIEDEFLGQFSAKLASQFLQEKIDYILDFDSFTLDSVKLYLEIDTIFGPSENNQTFKVYEITTDIESSVYSDENIQDYFDEGDLVSTGSNIDGDTLLVVPLTTDFGEKFFSFGDTLNAAYENVLEFFDGLAILPDSYENEGQILITNINSTNSKIVLYYNDTLSLNYRFVLGNKFGNYTNSFDAEDVSNYCNDSILFYQAISGVSSKIKFNNYKDIFDPDSNYSVLSAKIYMPIYKNEASDIFPIPDNLFMYYSDEDSVLTAVSDYNSAYFYSYGRYDNSNSRYTFNVSKHFQDILRGEIEDTCLNISMRAVYPYPYRVMLKKGENIRFKVTYTKH